MKLQEIQVRTGERYQFVSITDRVEEAIRESGVRDGFCLITSTHTTAAVTVNEDYDPDVGHDLTEACRALVPRIDFQHGEGNSDSHLLVSLIGQSEHLIISGGLPQLGRWQGVFLAEFDGPRTRTVKVAVFEG